MSTQQGGYVQATNLYYYYYYYYYYAKGKRLLKKATLRGIGDARGKNLFALTILKFLKKITDFYSPDLFLGLI